MNKILINIELVKIDKTSIEIDEGYEFQHKLVKLINQSGYHIDCGEFTMPSSFEDLNAQTIFNTPIDLNNFSKED